MVTDSANYLDIFRRHWKMVASACIIGVLVGWLSTPSKSDQDVVGALFTGTNILVLDDAAIAATETPLTLSQISARITAGEVPERVAARLGPDEDPGTLARRMSVTIDEDFGTLSIAATDRNGDRAAALANSFAEELIGSLNDRAAARYDALIAATNDRLGRLRAQIADVSARLGTSRNEVLTAERDALVARYAAAYNESQDQVETPAPTSGLVSLQPATPLRQEATGISVPRSGIGRGAIGGVVGLTLGLGLALLAERVDSRVRTKRSVEQVFGLPVIAEIPRIHRNRRGTIAVAGADRDTQYAESFRQLRTSILSQSIFVPNDLARSVNGAEPTDRANAQGTGETLPVGGRRWPPRPTGTAVAGRSVGTERTRELDRRDEALSHKSTTPQDSSLRVILVTSAGPGEGKTTVATNLAAIFAETSERVLVFDCDFRRPGVERMFEPAERPKDADGSKPVALPQPAWAGGSVVAQPADSTAVVGLATLAKATSVPGLSVVEVGASASAFDAITVARRLVTEARQYADIVVIDTAPMLMASVAGALVPDVDAVVIVARNGTTTMTAATEAGQRLARLDAPVLGVALLNAPPDRSARRYYRRAGGISRRRRNKAATPV